MCGKIGSKEGVAMDANALITRLGHVETIVELEVIRAKMVETMKAGLPEDEFERLEDAWCKAANRMRK